MNTDFEDLICCPQCKGVLDESNQEKEGQANMDYICNHCQVTYHSPDGYPDFIGEDTVIFKSRREKVLRSVYARFYTPSTNLMFLFCGGPKNARREVIEQLEIHHGDIILETGTGPGDNFPWILSKAENVRIFGIDIQKQMLKQSLQNSARWHMDTRLFRADAEKLPFRDKLFDVVFHLGAFNLFNNKTAAVNEMIRVARPGTKIVIADESEKGNRIFNRITGSNSAFEPPIKFIPDSMQDICEKEICRGYGYVISFRKP